MVVCVQNVHNTQNSPHEGVSSRHLHLYILLCLHSFVFVFGYCTMYSVNIVIVHTDCEQTGSHIYVITPYEGVSSQQSQLATLRCILHFFQYQVPLLSMFQPSLFLFIPTADSVAQCCTNYFLLFGKIPAFSRFSTGECTKPAWVSSRSPVCICIVFPFVFALAFVFPFVFGFGSCGEQLTHHLYAICLCFKAIPMKGAQHSVLNSVSNLFHSTSNMKRAQISILSFELCKQ